VSKARLDLPEPDSPVNTIIASRGRSSEVDVAQVVLARAADDQILEGRPMYATASVRDADIERDAPRPLDVHLTDVRESGARFQDAGAAPADWSRTVELRNGVVDSASRIPFRRWVEVELHHVDLGIGYDLEDLPEEFTRREIDFLVERFDGHPDVPSTHLTDGTHAWSTGRPPRSPKSPSPAALRISSAGSAGAVTDPA
jgi:maleylpyruvate isomerase